MSEQTPAEQPLDIITQLTVRPTSRRGNTHPQWIDVHASVKKIVVFSHKLIFLYILINCFFL